MSPIAFAPLIWGLAALTFIVMLRWWAMKSHERDHGMHHHPS